MTVYIKVTKDKYQLPIFVADSSRELSEMCGVDTRIIKKTMQNAKRRGGESQYQIIKIDDD